MIKHFRVQNYKALKDVSLELTPIHVLIGPNDSGKSSLLQALAALFRSADDPLRDAFPDSNHNRGLVSFGADSIVKLSARGNDDPHWSYEIDCRFLKTDEVTCVREAITIGPESWASKRQPSNNTSVNMVNEGDVNANFAFEQGLRRMYESISGVTQCRWIPRLLSLPVAPDSSQKFVIEPSGFGLARCLDDILGEDRIRFSALESTFLSYYPRIESLKLFSEPGFAMSADVSEDVASFNRSEGKGIHFQFRDGPLVRASQVSEGILMMLAFLTVVNVPKPPRLLLVEEPENGMHPERLTQVIELLKRFSEEQITTQVVLTTHSPYVVDLFQPEQVTVTRMQDDGTVVVRRLSESQLVRSQSEIFTLGEIWTAEGDEALSRPLASTPA